MLIPLILLKISAIAIGILITWLIFNRFRKRKKYVLGAFISLFAGIFFITGTIMMNSTVYVVKGKNNYSVYALYGSPEYKMNNGTSFMIEVPLQKCILINDSPEEMVIEKITYGYAFRGVAHDVLINAYSALPLGNASSIDYFFDDQPAKQVKSEQTGNVTRYWLRTKKDYDASNPNAVDVDKLNRIKELMKKKSEQNK